MRNNSFRIVLFFSFILISIIIFTCKKEKEIVLNGTSKITNGCDCSPPSQSSINNPCKYEKVKCIKHFFNNGGFSRNYTIKWKSGCGAFTTSQVYICFNSNCKMNFVFSNLPPCLSCCLQEDKCYETDKDNIGCGSHAITINFTGTDCNGFSMSFDITGDPEISVTCTDAYGNTFTTTGDLI
ncbi:MAG TPA: hypothetical protein PK995_01200 [Bacteroidia bacterium]|nr:hypothetical protein [Bacteroidia bacterium]